MIHDNTTSDICNHAYVYIIYIYIVIIDFWDNIYIYSAHICTLLGMSHLPRAIRKSSTPWLLCQCRACSMLTVPTATRTRAARAPRAWQAPMAWRAPRAWRAETAIWAATRRTGAPRFPFEGADDADGIWRMGWWWNMIDHWILWHLGLLLLFVSRSIYRIGEEVSGCEVNVRCHNHWLRIGRLNQLGFIWQRDTLHFTGKGWW